MSSSRRYVTDDDGVKPSPKAMFASIVAKAGLVLATALIALALYWGGVFTPLPKIDKATGCPVGVAVRYTIYGMLDNTDPWSDNHIKRINDRLLKVIPSMPDYGLLVVTVLNPDNAAAPREIFRRCAPRSPTRTSSVSAGSDVLRRDWEQKFEKPLLAAVADVAASTAHAKRTPLMATLATLTQSPGFDASVPERLLLVFSDLVEHDAAYSQMKGGDYMAAFRRSPLANSTWPDLKGVPVTIEYLQRAEPEFARVQTPAHRAFWEWWFKTAGATSVEYLGIREPPVLTLPPKAPPPNDPAKSRQTRKLAEEK